jgi:hypothetical protein
MRTQAAHKRERREAGREVVAAGQDPVAEKESRGVSMKQRRDHTRERGGRLAGRRQRQAKIQPPKRRAEA